jgi:hypothetical protein
MEGWTMADGQSIQFPMDTITITIKYLKKTLDIGLVCYFQGSGKNKEQD